MPDPATLQVIPAHLLPPATADAIHHLCRAAYGEDLSHLFAVYEPDFHLLAYRDGRPVSYAMVVTRQLQAGDGPLLRTAYVELVATAPAYQGRGIATALMERLAQAVSEEQYDLAALCPADTGLYRRLGWEFWQGPLFIRSNDNGNEDDNCQAGAEREGPALIATPEERVMILRLPGRPPLDTRQALSAEWRASGELW